MADDNQDAREFIKKTKENAAGLTSQDHIGADVKKVILDLLQICQNFENLMSSSIGANADTRLMKKRLEQANRELRIATEDQESLRALLLSLVDEIRVIGLEIGNLNKALPADGNNPAVQSIHGIHRATIRIVEAIAKSKKLTPPAKK